MNKPELEITNSFESEFVFHNIPFMSNRRKELRMDNEALPDDLLIPISTREDEFYERKLSVSVLLWNGHRTVWNETPRLR